MTTAPVWDPGAEAYVDSPASGDVFAVTVTAPSTQGVAAKTADYTLALSDAEAVVEVNKASAVTVTVPANADVAFDHGARVRIVQVGAGAVTVAGAVGVTVHPRPGHTLVSAGQWAALELYKQATNVWVASGDFGV